MQPSPLSPEPWLRGPLPGVTPVVMPVFFSFAQVREDLERHVNDLDPQMVWKPVPGGSLGFHLKHLAGSVDRLTTYLFSGELTDTQLATLHAEAEGFETTTELLALIDAELTRSEERLRTLDSATLFDPRSVGRQKLSTTVLGLLVHLAEHTQRHLGQCITLTRLLRRSG